jgi:hypothetical protein
MAAKNECGHDVPAEVSELAQQLGCVKGVKYVYRDGDYGSKRPVVSIGCRKASRFLSGTFDKYKVQLINGWVAFKSPSNVMRLAIPGITPPLYSRIGQITQRKKIDGSPLVFRVEDEEVFLALSNPKKAFCLQKILIDDGQGFENGHVEYRIFYYMIIHKSRGKGKWGYGQFAPMMTTEELALIVQKMKAKGWLLEK